MDRLVQYRAIIKRILTDESRYKPSHGEIEPTLVFDETRDHYQLLYVGWDKPRRVHEVILHIRLCNGKVWIERDGTESGVARQLLEAGVPKDDIVLAFHPPEKRRHTEFAVA